LREVILAPNGFFFGGDAKSWAYVDQNRMEFRTDRYGLRLLIGSSATAGAEGVQVLRPLNSGVSAWTSLLGDAQEVSANYGVDYNTRCLVSTASSSITITLPATTWNGQQVFVKKMGSGNIVLSGNNNIVQPGVATTSNSYEISRNLPVLLVYVAGKWYVMQGTN
jgi:hypothetical protein